MSFQIGVITFHSFKIYENAMQNLFKRTSKWNLLVSPDLRPDVNMSWAWLGRDGYHELFFLIHTPISTLPITILSIMTMSS